MSCLWEVEERLGARGRRVAFSTGYEAIDKETLQIVKETTGAARTEVAHRLSGPSARQATY